MSNSEVTDAQIQEWVEGLFSIELNDACFERLKLVTVRAVPFLVAALRDPRIPGTAFHPPIPPGLPNFQSPLNCASELLVDSGSEEAVAPFLEYLNGADARFQEEGAMYLGSLALESCIEPLVPVLAGKDEQIRSSALIGIERAITAGQGAPAFFLAIRPHLVNLLSVPDTFGWAPKLLMRLDARFATQILLAPERFSVENPQLHQDLKALNEARTTIPHELLLPLIDSLEPVAGRYPQSYAMSEALLAYARNPDARTESRLRAILQSPPEAVPTESVLGAMLPSPADKVQTGAARALAALGGLEDFAGKLIDIRYQQGRESLTEHEGNYYGAWVYYYEVMNGGLWQYFGNSTSDDHKMILAGLRAIGAPLAATVLEAAGMAFGPDGPPEDRVRRNEELDSFTPAQEEIVNDQNTDRVFGGVNIERLLFLYAADHRDHFRNCFPSNA